MIDVILGAVIAIMTTIFVEHQRKPKLSLAIESPVVDVSYSNHPAKQGRYLRVRCRNSALPWFSRWMSRSAALQCHGTITFHHLNDGQDVFGRSMPIRWSDSPEPVAAQIELGGVVGKIIDIQRFNATSRIDIYAGEDTPLDVAVKFDDEADCFGWSNLNYFSNPVWRNAVWKLPSGRYLAKVTVMSAGDRCEGLFRIVNDVPRDAFRLEHASKEDYERISR